MPRLRLAYLSFDTVPAPKGAATHITAFATALAAEFGELHLVTVSPTASEITHQWSNSILQTALPALGKTLIDRVLYFRHRLQHWWGQQRFEVIQIRSIYEGFPIAVNKSHWCDRLIFEVNGLPSIELKYRYPDVASDRELMTKLLAQEQICLDAADLILTPSRVTAAYLQTRHIAPEKIRVIPNGVDLDVFTYCDRPERTLPLTSISYPWQLLYFGTLAPWQGVDLAVRALALVQPDLPTTLTVISPANQRQAQALIHLAHKLGVDDQLTLVEPTSQAVLVNYLHQADGLIAPLTLSDRNLLQGCCPLKVLEGMAAGIPVITSDLPVIRELGESETHFLAVKPGSVGAIRDALVRLGQTPELGQQLAHQARQRIEQHYTWQQASASLVEAYQSLGVRR